MLCRNKTIKELLPAYVGEELDEADLPLVEEHLRACADCAREAMVLRMMAEGPVPDPGDAFWSEMPERVYRAVRQEDKKRPRRNLHDLLQGVIIPRWAWTAVAAGIVLAVSWLIVHPATRETTVPALPGDEYSGEYSYEEVSHYDPVLRHTSVTMAEMTPSELDAVDAWAARELSSIAREAGTNVANVFDTDLYEELTELNSHEVERLSKMLQKSDVEG
jgi:hypothetical protein